MKRLLPLLLLPSLSLADDFHDPDIDIGQNSDPCSVPYQVLAVSENPALIALGASWEKGGFLDPAKVETHRYISRLGQTLGVEYFAADPTTYVLARNGDVMQHVYSEQLGEACLLASRHREAGVVMVVGMTNDVSEPVSTSDACLGPEANFADCVADVHAPAGLAGFEAAEARLATAVVRLARMAATGWKGGALRFAPDTRLVLVNQFNPLDALHATQGPGSCELLSSLDPASEDYDFTDFVQWVDFIQGVPGVTAEPASVPVDWMPWRERIARVADQVASEYPGLEVEVLDLHHVLDGLVFSPFGQPSLQGGNTQACFHLTEAGHERVCRAMANVIGVSGDWCDFGTTEEWSWTETDVSPR